MKKVGKILAYVGAGTFTLFNFMLFFGLNGQAYIDPSVITYLIQIISGVIISLGAFFGVYGRKFKKMLSDKLGINENVHKEVESDEIKIW